MQGLALVPGRCGSLALTTLAEPVAGDARLVVEAVAVGVCGTDREIAEGRYGQPPPGEDRLVIGHESIGRVIAAPPGSGFSAGDWVVGIVRRPDPVPCTSCAVGEWDMCRNGRYTEHGIKGLHGFARERFALEPAFAVKVEARLGALGVLLEPASIVAKAWDHVERIGGRARFVPERVLVTGAGPIGLLAALLGAQRALEVHVLDRAESGPKPALVRALGGRYHTESIEDLPQEFDIVVECTGAAPVIFGAIRAARAGGIVCLTGVSSGGHVVPVDVGALNRELVLENTAIFGSVNANRAHYEQAAAALARADRDWLARLITRRVPLAHWEQAFAAAPDDVKAVIVL